MQTVNRIALVLGFASIVAGADFRPAGPLPPTPLPELNVTNEFFPGTKYRAEVPRQETVIGFPVGARAATHGEIERCLHAWTNAAPDRTRLVEYARSYENRALYYMIVTAPDNMRRLDEIQRGLAALADPRKTSDAAANELIASLPAVGWLGYTIHGDETEGSDAALALLYHLIAADDPAVNDLLERVVVIIDPLMNPDGRDRFVKMIAEHRGTTPNVDDQSMIHDGYWPWGRGNHYLFDLNRDPLWCVHPETRGRIREIGRWNPQLLVDAHGMGPRETHLFSPPREPININVPKGRLDWGQRFARDQAEAFDRHGLLYYTGEWHEEWYPGYTDAWGSLRGAIGILYEQPRIAEDGVRRPEGRILTYRESVQHHLIGSMANLNTLKNNSRALLEYFYRTRKTAVDPNGPYANRTFALLPTSNRSRWLALIDLLQQQGFELYSSDREFTAPLATDQLGRELRPCVVPAGSLLIPNRQPLAHLLSAALEFDPHLSQVALEEESKELLAKGRSKLYDTTAWNITMLYGLPALTLSMELPQHAAPLTNRPSNPLPTTAQTTSSSPTAFVIDGADDSSAAAAARLVERGVQVRIAEKPFRFDKHDFARGSVVVTRLDNRSFSGDLRKAVYDAAAETGLTVFPVCSGLGAGDLPDLGGEHFQRLEPPRIALLTRGSVSATDYGSIWFTIDHKLGIRHSHVDDVGRLDLSRYNVVVVPDARASGISTSMIASLKDWIRNGGTLIAIGGSTSAFTQEKADLSKVRALPEVLSRLAEYELVILREWMAQNGELPAAESVWSHLATPNLRYPWQMVDGPHPDEKELRKRDAWQSLFMPQGAVLAARVNTNHWLTAGCGEWLPVVVGRQPILMAGDGVEAPIRYGYLTRSSAKPAGGTEQVDETSTSAADSKRAAKSSVGSAPNQSGGAGAEPSSNARRSPSNADSRQKEKDKEPPRVGWAALPPGAEMHLRMSGLLWPEAAHRLANAAWVTRESCGRGQIILFATPPTFRAATAGTTRVFLNALVYGPGFGAAQPVRP
ncbi:MAG: M14 family metallopeptidase [Verrucomicrobiota bacterium]|nr:M14 family metallopeptidase [Verrucomicrobiota bacterium]